MCLANPGLIIAIHSPDLPPSNADPSAVAAPLTPDMDESDPQLWRTATVDYGGVLQEVSLACLPEARLGDRVLVHVGLAISLVEA
jgi:hydrogenase expression/formation protein HypC